MKMVLFGSMDHIWPPRTINNIYDIWIFDFVSLCCNIIGHKLKSTWNWSSLRAQPHLIHHFFGVPCIKNALSNRQVPHMRIYNEVHWIVSNLLPHRWTLNKLTSKGIYFQSIETMRPYIVSLNLLLPQGWC